MKTIDKILHRMKQDGPVTAKALSEELGLTTMGVRQHLQGLEEDGLVGFDDIKAKVGRPTRHWHLTAKGHEQFADRHGDLIIQMLDSVENLFGQEGLQKILNQREESTLSQYQQAIAKAENLKEKLQILTTLREKEGYMAQLESDDDGFVLIENHCPICHAAKRCPSLCRSELAVFQRLLGDSVVIERSEHIIAGQRRCSYRIYPT
ncbi:metalloregulator ArsR/SmtB family transcription factor [Photobacterium sp. 1_MG-2023]|uniref:helix-turn-helix transcriptional regulator n=1 Tax=Photobacterium sp. 1_MG-2023 TaxID=3062646 RepID=UPI0026E46C4F|nr:metalloregulator ArsR/SmtB family transcription factor [Photobacterium sp. 1_MG-2023]MDO6706259.1 transcriptional regulator [Photobacterium sp. 1_MG-2023]